MRNAFAKKVKHLAAQDKRVVLLMGDIGNRMFDEFKQEYPDRFYNCGIAEQNMIGLAAGLASQGLRPVTYTITPFTTLRCLEQLRNDVSYPKLPVIVIGTGAGMSYAGLGVTHHSLEDVSVIRSLPNFDIYCPGDSNEVALSMDVAFQTGNPSYIRIGKKGEPVVHLDDSPEVKFVAGSTIPIVSGSQALILSMGNMLPIALETSNILKKKGVSVSVDSAFTVRPLPEARIAEFISAGKKIFIVEEHYRSGGLGSAVLEFVNDEYRGSEKSVYRFGFSHDFKSASGSQEAARAAEGFTPAGLAKEILKFVITK